jgi:5-methyltetrahydropteroyltriglutamate--homocysteine methyltransferase
MYRATQDRVLPTTVIGSLPRPEWYTETLGKRSFVEAMVNSRFREQYCDAVSAYLSDQVTAGLDVCTDGDCRFDTDVGGQSWFTYPLNRLGGFDHDNAPDPAPSTTMPWFARGSILHEWIEARLVYTITGPVNRGTLQYAALWKAAQRLTDKPVKFGTITAELIAQSARDLHYKDRRERIMAVSDALNTELHDLADAGCPVIQMEEPQIHSTAVRGTNDGVITPQFLVDVFNNTVRGLRAKTEVWCHTCWGNPYQQRLYDETPSYRAALAALNRLDCDALTFETCSSAGRDFEAIGREIADKKIAIGAIDHHTLQVERPEQVAALVRAATAHIPPERLIVASDCGMGRDGMSRKHAFYKMVALVLGTNAVRRELGLAEAHCLAADGRYSLTQ